MNCLLCLEDKDDIKSLIDVLSEEGQTLEVQKIVEQHFWLRFEENQLNSKKYVCRLCWNPIFTFHQFYVRVEQAHNPLQEIALKLDCDVIIDTQPLPVLDVSEEPVQIKTEPLAFFESNDVKSILENQKKEEDVVNSLLDEIEDIKAKDNLKESIASDKEDANDIEMNGDETGVGEEDKLDYKKLDIAISKKRRGRPKKSKEKEIKTIAPIVINRRPKRKTAAASAAAAVSKAASKAGSKTTSKAASKAASRAATKAASTVILTDPSTVASTNASTDASIGDSNTSSTASTAKKVESKVNIKKIKQKNCEENSDGGSDSDHPFNDVDYEVDLNDCDSEVEPEKPTKSQGKEKYMITRQSDAYIATHFKLSCCLCNEDLNDFNYLKLHFRSKHKVRGYVYCCQKKFLKRGLLVDHLRTHEDPEYFKCPTCDKVMADRRCLDIHLKLHEGNRERVFQCKICTKGFFKKAIYNRHMLLHIPEDEKKEICPTCNKAFPTKYILKQHIHLTHLNTYASICDVCGKAVRGGRELFQRHMTQHTGETLAPVQCQICGTTVTTKYGLSRHMRTMHNEEQRKPLQCKICSKVSPSLQAHKSHMKYMHNTERKHQCPMCKKAFKRPTELKEHLSTHTGEILYTCPHCPKTFKSNANMHSHRKKMHRAEWEERRQQRFKATHLISNASEQDKNKTEQPDELPQLSLDQNTLEDQNLSKADYFETKHELFSSLDATHTDIDHL